MGNSRKVFSTSWQGWGRTVITGRARLGGRGRTIVETYSCCYPLVMTNIAMGNGPFIDGLPIKNGDFPWLC